MCSPNFHPQSIRLPEEPCPWWRKACPGKRFLRKSHCPTNQRGTDAFEKGGKLWGGIGPGDLIGLMGSIDGRDYEGTTVAITDCQLIPIDKKRAEYLFREHPTFGFHVMKMVIDRFYFAMHLVRQYCDVNGSN